MEDAVNEKRRCFKLHVEGRGLSGCIQHNTAKGASNRAAHQVRSETEKVAL